MPNPKILAFFCNAIIEATAGDAKGPPKFSMDAYNGGMMRLDGFSRPVVVDLSGLTLAAASLPIRFQHDPGRGVGHTTKINNDGKTLSAAGVISRMTPDALEVVQAAGNGYPWQASIGAMCLEAEYIDEKTSVKVNGQAFKGPLIVARKTMLNEISFVDLGADTSTSATIAASAKKEIETMTDEEIKAAAEAKKAAEIKAANDALAAQAAQDIETRAIFAQRAAAHERAALIEEAGKGHPKIIAQALKENWSVDKVSLEVIRASRATAPNAIILNNEVAGTQILEAAVAQATKTPDAEKTYGDKTMQAAHARYKGSIGLNQLIIEAAYANGYTGPRAYKVTPEIMRAAFAPQIMQAEAFNSNADIAGILSNIANKHLLLGFFFTEQVWRDVSAIRPVNDFKTITNYRLTGVDTFDQVAPGGELKHGTLGNESFTNQANTFGKLLSVDRRMIINDDLGAISTVPQKLGRGAGLKLNLVFWTEFMANSTFFTAGATNYITGAGTVLGIDSLTTANTTFNKQVDGDGQSIGLDAERLLVPTELEMIASVLMKSTEVRGDSGGTTVKYGIANPWSGRFKVSASRYLSNTAIVGNSAVAWYLLGNPGAVPVIETCFLNGQESPVIQTAEAEFNTLGIQMRGYFDFGVTKQDGRGGVKSKGAA